MRWFCIVLSVVLFPLVTRAADGPDSSKLVGAWKASQQGVDVTMTFNKDGTFSSNAKMGDKEMTMTGTWSLEGNTLTEKCTKSSMPERVGQSHTMTVTSVTDDKLDLQDGPDKEDAIELDRAKDDK